MEKKKIKFQDVECVVKWYDIIGKIVFWDSKIKWDNIFGWKCSKANILFAFSFVSKQSNPLFN